MSLKGQMTTAGWRTFLFLALILVFMVACSTQESPGNSQPSGSTGNNQSESDLTTENEEEPQELESITFRFEFVTNGQHAPYYLALEKGYYKEAGLDVEFEGGTRSATTAQAVGNRSVMIGDADAATVMQLIAQGLPIKMFGGWLQSGPHAFMSKEGSGITEPTDLIGKKIGTTAGDATTATMPAYFKAIGYSMNDIELINVDAASKAVALAEDQVDAIASFGYYLSPILAGSGTPNHVLPYVDVGVNLPSLAFITHIDNFEERPDVLRRFMEATVRGFEDAMADPDEAVEAYMKHDETGSISAEVHREILVNSFDLFHTERTQGRPFGCVDPADIADAEDLLVEYLGVETRRDPDEYFTNEFVPGC